MFLFRSFYQIIIVLTITVVVNKNSSKTIGNRVDVFGNQIWIFLEMCNARIERNRIFRHRASKHTAFSVENVATTGLHNLLGVLCGNFLIHLNVENFIQHSDGSQKYDYRNHYEAISHIFNISIFFIFHLPKLYMPVFVTPSSPIVFLLFVLEY